MPEAAPAETRQPVDREAYLASIGSNTTKITVGRTLSGKPDQAGVQINVEGLPEPEDYPPMDDTVVAVVRRLAAEHGFELVPVEEGAHDGQ